MRKALATSASTSSSSCRTARIEDFRYWLWRFPAAGLASYALVMQDAEGPWLTCHQSLGGMAPEDVLIADYRTVSGNP